MQLKNIMLLKVTYSVINFSHPKIIMSTGTLAFGGGTLIVSAAGAALFIANAVHFDRARTNCNSISSTTANTLFWLNAILAVIFFLWFIWALFIIITHPRVKGETTTKTVYTAAPAPTTDFAANVVPAPTTGLSY